MKTEGWIKSYSDIGFAAFGKGGKMIITFVFFLELFMATCANMVLIGDNLKLLFPFMHIDVLKCLAIIVILPTCLPGKLSFLSYASIVGIIGTFFLYLVLIADGFVKPDFPGSLRSPAETYILPKDWMAVPVSFGVIMFSFGGHAVIPNL